LTWGWGKTGDRIGSRQIAGAIGIHDRHARQIVADLLRWRVLRETGPSFRGRRHLGIEKDFDRWRIASKTRTGKQREVARRGSTSEVARRGSTSTFEVARGRAAEVARGRADSKERKERLVLRRQPCRTSSEEDRRRSTSKAATDDATRLAALLRAEILRTHPNARLPANGKLGPWERDVDRMIRLDKRQPDDVERTIRWVFGPNLTAEASFVVLSPRALRAKFDRIAVQMGRLPHGGPRVPEGTWRREG
jgi:hypothetical protein